MSASPIRAVPTAQMAPPSAGGDSTTNQRRGGSKFPLDGRPNLMQNVQGDGHRHTFTARPQPSARKAKGGTPSDRFNFAAAVGRGWGTTTSAKGSEVMTEDKDFKRVVRTRSAKTGESYQAARRQLKGKQPVFSARVDALFRTPDGLAFGCVVEEGSVSRGMSVTVIGDGVSHAAIVTSLRRSKWDVETVAFEDSEYGHFGMIIEPPYPGAFPVRVTA